MSATNCDELGKSLEECHALIRKQQAEIADLKAELYGRKRMVNVPAKGSAQTTKDGERNT